MHEVFYEQLGYKVVGKTPGGAPSLSEDFLIELRLKNNNPVIDILIEYRRLKTETTRALTFNDWTGYWKGTTTPEGLLV